MPRMPLLPAIWKIARGGNLRARMRVNRDGLAAIRLHVGRAALESGALDHLAAGGATTAELARELHIADEHLLETLLRVAAATGLVRDDGRQWELTASGDRRRPRARYLPGLLRLPHRAVPGTQLPAHRRSWAALTDFLKEVFR